MTNSSADIYKNNPTPKEKKRAEERRDKALEIKTQTCPMCKRQAIGDGTNFSCECGMSWLRLDSPEE